MHSFSPIVRLLRTCLLDHVGDLINETNRVKHSLSPTQPKVPSFWGDEGDFPRSDVFN